MKVEGAILITGAGSGIGQACALHLAHMGFTVFVGVRREEDLERFRGGVEGRLIPVLLDVADTVSIAAAERTVREAVGDAGLAGLVNNAGISVAGPLEVLPVEELRAQLEVNVLGVLAVTQAFLPLLRQARGRVVNIGSISGRAVLPFLGAYAASKHALEGLTDALRMEMRPWGIAVSIIEPGRVATPFTAKTAARSRAIATHLSPEALQLYGPTYAAVERLEVGRKAMSVDGTVDAVIDALTRRRPRPRYVIGRDAWQRLLLSWLPAAIGDRIILRRLARAGSQVGSPAEGTSTLKERQ